MSHPGCTIFDMQSQLALVLEENYSESLEEDLGETLGLAALPGLAEVSSGSLGVSDRSGKTRSNKTSSRAGAISVRKAFSRRRSGLGVLSQRTCRLGRVGVAEAKARLAALPDRPEIDLGAA